MGQVRSAGVASRGAGGTQCTQLQHHPAQQPRTGAPVAGQRPQRLHDVLSLEGVQAWGQEGGEQGEGRLRGGAQGGASAGRGGLARLAPCNPPQVANSCPGLMDTQLAL